MTDTSEKADLDALTNALKVLQPLSPDARTRVVGAISKFFGLEAVGSVRRVGNENDITSISDDLSDTPTSFSEDRTPSPKEFMFEKQPKSDVERIACLAYYLTHYREVRHFKTLDLSKLNTEAAQLKFSNAAYAAINATRQGYLVPAPSKGKKQISAIGELYVQALPDRAAARAAIADAKPKRRNRRTTKPAKSQAKSGKPQE